MSQCQCSGVVIKGRMEWGTYPTGVKFYIHVFGHGVHLLQTHGPAHECMFAQPKRNTDTVPL